MNNADGLVVWRPRGWSAKRGEVVVWQKGQSNFTPGPRSLGRAVEVQGPPSAPRWWPLVDRPCHQSPLPLEPTVFPGWELAKSWYLCLADNFAACKVSESRALQVQPKYRRHAQTGSTLWTPAARGPINERLLVCSFKKSQSLPLLPFWRILKHKMALP